MNKVTAWQLIIDVIWLTVIMVGLIIANKHESIYEYMHYISLMLWYMGARYLCLTWKN